PGVFQQSPGGERGARNAHFFVTSEIFPVHEGDGIRIHTNTHSAYGPEFQHAAHRLPVSEVVEIRSHTNLHGAPAAPLPAGLRTVGRAHRPLDRARPRGDSPGGHDRHVPGRRRLGAMTALRPSSRGVRFASPTRWVTRLLTGSSWRFCGITSCWGPWPLSR